MTTTIRAAGLTRTYGDATVLRDVDLDIGEGTIYGFIGPSGSGKTTCVRALTGVIEPTAGTVEVLGTDPRHLSTEQRERIGYMPQLGVLYPHLSIMDNLRFTAALYGSVRKQRARIDEMLEFLQLDGHGGKRLSSASGGMQRRVALAAALLHEPDVMFLDEPTSGLDPVLRHVVFERLGELRDQGRTLFVTTQIVSEATSCDRVGLIVEGRVIAEGTPEQLRRRAQGGDVLQVHSVASPPPRALERLREDDRIRAVVRTDTPTMVRVTVDDADADTEVVTGLLTAEDVEVRLVERHLPPFDDIFVGLLRVDRSATDVPEEDVA